MDQRFPYFLPELPYSYNGLAPAISAKTLYFHHDKHLQSYIENLNKVMSVCPVCREVSLVELLGNLEQVPTENRMSIRNNGGGVFNHIFYFNCMSPNGGGLPSRSLAQKITDDFGSFEIWRSLMKAAASELFGSGYAWLVADSSHNLSIVKSQNQDCPLSYGLTPLLAIDVWEHAYYLDYQNRKKEYIDAWFGLINWPFVETQFARW